jgi:SOS response regulatory protein OraA/RecX
MNDALKFLAHRTYSATELRERLGKKHSADVVESVIGRLEATGLVSEQRVLDSFSNRFRDKRSIGNARMSVELQKLGLTSEIAEWYIAEVEAPEEIRAYELVRAKFNKSTDPAKIGRFLYSRGFDESTIESVLENLSWAESE